MIRYKNKYQPTLIGFETFFERALDEKNRWVKLRAEGYYRNLSSSGTGRPAKDAQLVIGAVIIKAPREVVS